MEEKHCEWIALVVAGGVDILEEDYTSKPGEEPKAEFETELWQKCRHTATSTRPVGRVLAMSKA